MTPSPPPHTSLATTFISLCTNHVLHCQEGGGSITDRKHTPSSSTHAQGDNILNVAQQALTVCPQAGFPQQLFLLNFFFASGFLNDFSFNRRRGVHGTDDKIKSPSTFTIFQKLNHRIETLINNIQNATQSFYKEEPIAMSKQPICCRVVGLQCKTGAVHLDSALSEFSVTSSESFCLPVE